MEEAEQARSERTSGTFLSGLSDCSNLTFRKVQRYWESNSAAHKEVERLPLQQGWLCWEYTPLSIQRGGGGVGGV